MKERNAMPAIYFIFAITFNGYETVISNCSHSC